MPRPRHRYDRLPDLKSRGHLKVVLVSPQAGENIGGVARAMGNMGLTELALVKPGPKVNWPKMRVMATFAGEEPLKKMRLYASLEEAVADCRLVIGTTARLGSHRGPFFTPREVAEELLALPSAPSGPVKGALVFGPERMGLSTKDLRLCQRVVRIPTHNPEVSSLNLAQAVLIFGYELLLAAGGQEPTKRPAILPASSAELAGLYEHLEKTLLDIGFLPTLNPGHWLMNLKKIFNRSLLTSGECNLLRGICRQIEARPPTGKPVKK